MTEEEKQETLYAELEKLTCRCMEEFDMTYISVMGALELLKVSLACEAFGVQDEEGEEGEDGDEWKIIIDDD